jgi:hypothetical protein
LDLGAAVPTNTNSDSKTLAKMTSLAKFWKKSQKHSSNRLAI